MLIEIGRTYNYHIAGLEKDLMPIFYLSYDDYERFNENLKTGITNLTLVVLENEYAEFYHCTAFLVTKVVSLVIFSVMTIFVFLKLVL